MQIVHSLQHSSGNGPLFLLHSHSLPPPCLLCMTALLLHTEWMRAIGRVQNPKKQDLRNVSKANGDQGGREKSERRTRAREAGCSQIYSGRQEQPSPPHIPYLFQCVHACTLMHTRKHIIPIPPPRTKGDLRHMRLWTHPLLPPSS